MGKKIFVKAYMAKNLGDDLFLKIFADRYAKNNKIYIYSTSEYKKMLDNKIIVCKNIFTIAFNKLLKFFSRKKADIQLLLYRKADYVVQIGGSIFIESKDTGYKNNINLEYPKNKKYYILGSNFGPYETKEYFETYKNIFENAEDVCFREEKSYNLFKTLPNVRRASDIIYSLDTSNLNLTNRKRVIISVIDCETKINKKYQKDYEEKIIDIVNFFSKKGYEVLLMSFCQKENDEKTVKNILEKVGNKASKYYYRGNINEALNVLADSEIIVGSRLHANIIGLTLGKTVIPMIYSDKLKNILDDINFNGKVIDIKNLNNFDINTFTEDDLSYKISIDKQKKSALEHFKKLDLELCKNMGNNIHGN